MPARLSTEQFIAKAIEIHGETYLYDKVDYSTSHRPVIISCKEHGEFEQAPNSHLNGRGCPKCGRTRTLTEWSIGREEFIRRSREIHGAKYDYSECEFDNVHKKVRIVCPYHGPFMQKANSHMRVSGCPSCPRNGNRYGDPSSVYVLGSDNGCKIGVAIDPSVRIARLKRTTPFEITSEWHRVFDNWFAARAIESAVHRILSEKRCAHSGFDGASEWFSVSRDVALEAVIGAAAIISEGRSGEVSFLL